MTRSNQDKAREYACKLEEYLNECREGVRQPPMRGGMLNKSQVAKDCGFLRGVLVENKECKALIDAALIEFGGGESERSDQESQSGEVKALERKVQQLEIRIADLLVENAELKSEKNMEIFAEEWLSRTGWIIKEPLSDAQQ